MVRAPLFAVVGILLPAFSHAAEVTPGPEVAAQPAKPAIARGAKFMGFAEKFNRYYTDPSWKPARTVYVSPNGSGNGRTRANPKSVPAALADARPGDLIHFNRGKYNACYELDEDRSGTYAKPIVLYGERTANQSLGVSINCCGSGRQTCINLENASYVAVDGFELIGGAYGVRVVGAGYAASEHARGAAVLNSVGHDQDRDPFFSGQTDWAVWEENVAYGAGTGDGHGIYLSNGSDWNIVRRNETFSNSSSDFQINADPFSTCQDEGIAFDDPRCDAYAGTGEGGRGASDYFLVDGNYFHHSDGPGANFTSVRRSVVRNNVFGFAARHNVSFWQETDNPKLGSRENDILHNLFITTDRHALQFVNNSTKNRFINNVLLGVRITGGQARANPAATLLEVDGTVGGNVYRGNLYVAGRMEGRSPNANETKRSGFSAAWYKNFPLQLNHNANAFKPTASAPFLGKGDLVKAARKDRNGKTRKDPVDLGPIEVP